MQEPYTDAVLVQVLPALYSANMILPETVIESLFYFDACIQHYKLESTDNSLHG